MARCKDRVQYKEEKQTELLELDVEVYTPNCDSRGNVIWSPMKYITRHDPDEVLYEVETMAGRKVIVTQYDSMLVWDKEKEEFLSKPTPDVQLGEFVPVTSKMPTPPILTKYVDVSDYLPKDKFVYGTDFHLAKNMLEYAMQDGLTLPNGWWAEHNGKDFTVPYPQQSRFQRVLVKSDITAIKEGCVHNYDTQRGEFSIPDEFPLDKDFGTFIGLYLADGSCHVKSGNVTISNVDDNVLKFLEEWFDKYNITYKIHSTCTVMKQDYVVSQTLTCSIQVSSTILAKFLGRFVGHGDHNKFIPQEAYGAPEEFIVGLLKGYFAGDGTVSRNSLEASSTSKKLIDGVAHLCSRLGAFGKIKQLQTKKNVRPTYSLDIRYCFADRLRSKLDMIIGDKNCSDVHNNFKELNDVVMDTIKSIIKVDTAKYPKVYDVSIPGTYNLMTGNGLNLKDTSETGYLQRKLVKAMEDCKINYDYTVRNANGSIIQFLYGEDGMDPIKIEQQSLPYIEMDYAKLYKDYNLCNQDDFEYVLDDAVTKDLKKDSNWEEPFKAHFDQILKDREFMIKTIFKSKQNNQLMYPVSFARIINNAKMLLAKYDLKVPSDLNPKYVLETINSLCQELFISKANRGDMIIGILIRCYLSPKQVIFNYKFNKDTFDHVVQQIKLRFFQAIANPSEMVGVVAAQSIGEPCTQLSSSKDTKIVVYKRENGKSIPFKTTIGEFIDTVLAENKAHVVELGGDSVVYDPSSDYYIVGVSDTEKTSWNRILQVSKHPANGGMVRVKTRSGKTTSATLSHSFLKRSESKIVPIKGSDLKVGDRIPVAKYIPVVENAFDEIDGFKLDRDFGWFCGAYLANGNINYNEISISKVVPEFVEHLNMIVTTKFGHELKIHKQERTVDIHKHGRWNKRYLTQDNSFTNKEVAEFIVANFATGSNKKTIPGWVFTSNLEFIKGLIGGYFDGDGNVANLLSKEMIRAHSVNESLIEDMLVLLNFVGIFGTKALEKKKDFQDLHTIQVSRKYAKVYKDNIGFIVKSKQVSLDEVIHFVDGQQTTQYEYIDKIPELGNVIASIGKSLELKGQSKYNKRAIGRNTLTKYIETFTEANKKKCIKDVEDKIQLLHQAAYSDVVWDEIISLEYLDDPKEYVYDFTVPGNDSFMVDCGVLVHNTLNSVEWNTELLVDIDGKLEKVKIGDFIDKVVDNTTDSTKVEKHPNDTTLVWIKEKNIKIMSCNEDGKMTWEQVEAVTQHPPINKDGTNTLLNVTLQSGREVIATKAKSFLKRTDNKIKEVNGDELQVGDYIPISMVMNPNTIISKLDVEQYLPKEHFLYQNKCQNSTSKIPEHIPLDKNFGFIVGAYAAEGGVTGQQTIVSNITDDFNKVVDEFCSQYSVEYHIDSKVSEKGFSKTLHLHSTILTYLFTNMIGTGSKNKRLPGWVLQAPDEFIGGVIDGYFGGDGTINKNDSNCISATSISKGLLEDIQQILIKYKINSTLNIHDTPRFHVAYKLTISCENAQRFIESFGLTIPDKLENLQMLANKPVYDRSLFDVIPSIVTKTYGDISLHRDKVVEYYNNTIDEDDKNVFKLIMDEDIMYDKIVSITDFESKYPYVYDLTVANTKNFNTYNGIAMRDTFHHSGISSASKAVRGVPRIKELLSVTKNIKAPSMTVYLKDEYKKDKMKANEVLQSIKTTFFKNVRKSSKSYYDANDFTTDLENDLDFVNSYRELMELDLMKKYDTAPWLLRIEVNREKLLEEGINMITLYNILQEYYEDTICCMFSDDNSSNLIFRIKLIEDPNQDEDRDYITELKALEKNIMDNVLIKGIKNINKSMMNKQQYQLYNDESMQFENTFEWVLDTSGTNLVEIMCHPKVDFTKTVSNDINEIYELLGIEAAREALYHELSSVIGDAELYVNYRHIALLVDTMTNRGYLLSIDRHGINRVDVGPLAKCSFEETTDMLIKAGIFSEVDKITGVSANIMLGQIPPCGTGDTQILIDEHKLLNNLEVVDEEEHEEDIDPDVADVCTLDNLSFDFKVPTRNQDVSESDIVNDFEVKIV